MIFALTNFRDFSFSLFILFFSFLSLTRILSQNEADSSTAQVIIPSVSYEKKDNYFVWKFKDAVNGTRSYTEKRIVSRYPHFTKLLLLFQGKGLYESYYWIFSKMHDFFIEDKQKKKGIMMKGYAIFATVFTMFAFTPADPLDLFASLRSENYQSMVTQAQKESYEVEQKRLESIKNEKRLKETHRLSSGDTK